MEHSPRERLIRASMSLAVVAIISTVMFPVIPPYIFGSVALVLAILSKGDREHFTKNGKRAAFVASAALIINTCLILSSVLYMVRVLHDPQLQAQFSQTLYQMYGMTFEEFMQLLPIRR